MVHQGVAGAQYYRVSSCRISDTYIFFDQMLVMWAEPADRRRKRSTTKGQKEQVTCFMPSWKACLAWLVVFSQEQASSSTF